MKISANDIKAVFEAALTEDGTSVETYEMTQLLTTTRFVVSIEEFGNEAELFGFSEFDAAKDFADEVSERNDRAKIRMYDLNLSYMTTDKEMFFETAY